VNPNDFSNLELATVDEFLQERKDVITDFNWPAFKERLDEMNHKNESGSRSGDIIVILDGREGYQTVNRLGDVFPGWHGGPTVSESHVPLMFAMPGQLFIDDSGNSINSPIPLSNGFAQGRNNAAVKGDGCAIKNTKGSEYLKNIRQKKIRLIDI